MELIARNPRNSPEARRKMVYLLSGLWIAGLAVFFISHMSNWGVLALAAGLSIFELFSQTRAEDSYKISMDENGISITNGPNFLWNSSFGHLKEVEIADEARKLGVVFSPKRLIFHKTDGDQYAIDIGFFKRVELDIFLEEVRQHTQVFD